MRKLIVASVFTLFQNFLHFGNNVEVNCGQQGWKISDLSGEEYQKPKVGPGKLIHMGNLIVVFFFTLSYYMIHFGVIRGQQDSKRSKIAFLSTNE